MAGDNQHASTVPGQDPSLWGQELFVNAKMPVDWCTIRQAQELVNKHEAPKSVLAQIASGEIISNVFSPQEAQALLEALQKRSTKER